MASNPFTRHPREVGESYPEHFTAAAGFGVQMWFVAAVRGGPGDRRRGDR